MKKVMLIVLSLIFVLSFAACGETGGTQDKADTSNKTKAVTGEVIKAEFPSGWCLVTSTEMTGTSGADFICHSEKYEFGDAYLQVIPDSRNVETIKEILVSTDPYGEYYGQVELANGTWYTAENAATAFIGEKTLIVKGYEIDFGSEEVLSILGSLQLAE